MPWSVWIGFVIGVLLRWGDRIQFVISEGAPGHTLSGFFRNNSVRLLIRGLGGAYCFHLMVAADWVPNELVAFSIGMSFDHVFESFLDRAKKGGETILAKFKNSGE